MRLIIALVFALCSTTVQAQNALPPTARGPLDGATIVIDPGHGAGDPGCQFILDRGSIHAQYWEAAYTYVAAYDLANLIRANGGSVYLTCISQTVADFVSPNAQTPRPRPIDAVYDDTGETVEHGDQGGLKHRAAYCSKVYAELGKPDNFFFIALHVDAMGSRGWAGSHVCYQRGQTIPALAQAMGNRIDLYRCSRTQNGQPRRVIESRGLGVLRTNAAQEAVLLEMAIPENPTDSWRIRKDSNRMKYLENVPLAALIDLVNPGQSPNQRATKAETSLDDETPTNTATGERESRPEPAGIWGFILGFTGLGTLISSFSGFLFAALIAGLIAKGAIAVVNDRASRTTKELIISAVYTILIFSCCFLGSRLWWIYFSYGMMSSLKAAGNIRYDTELFTVSKFLNHMIVLPMYDLWIFAISILKNFLTAAGRS